MELKGKVAVVIGASRGCGKHFAIGLAREGAAVVVAARSVERGTLPGTIGETVDIIRREGGKAHPVQCDAANTQDVHKTIGEAVYHFGRLDCLVYNAALYTRRPFLNVTPEMFDDYIAVNVRGPLFAAQAALPHMIAQGGGSIVNITSAASTKTTMPHLVMYSITKAALDRLSTWLANEYREHNIAVNSLSPGPVVTEALEAELPADYDWQHEKYGWKPATPEYLGPPIVHLAKQDAKGITGQVVRVPDFGKSWP
ncbi:MAG: SDR family oxidoreductase [Chloroflexi bacterium]|nr:SDR family oxidoreductase [Chloroflexota bacterium]